MPRGRSGRRLPQRAVHLTDKVPSFTGGVNAQAPLSGMSPDEAIFLYNIIPSESGCKIRAGTQEWCNEGGGTPMDTRIGTYIPFTGADGSTKKLFAVDVDGIWDVSTEGANQATQKLAFGSTDVSAGRGTWTAFTNSSGAEYIYYADAVHGLHLYTASTDTWATASGFTGLTVGNVRIVFQHKLRLWFVEEGGQKASYLDIGAINGTVTDYYFGSAFRAGGAIAGLYNWSRDGGAGPDDWLVVVGRAGDVTAYEGYDPSDSTLWELKGTWSIGRIPEGHRFGYKLGGELFLLSQYGLLTMSAIFQGVDQSDFRSNPTAKITKLIRARMATEIDDDGWEVIGFPAEGAIVIASPIRLGHTDEMLQYVFNVTTQTWGFWRDVPGYTFIEYDSKMYFGDENGITWYMTEGTDNRTIADTDDSEVEPIIFSILGSFQTWGDPAKHTIPQFLRPTFLGRGVTDYNIQVVFDYRMAEVLSGDLSNDPGQYVWDTGTWDSALWGDEQVNVENIVGATGIGHRLAIAIKGQAVTRSELLETNIAWTQGGFL